MKATGILFIALWSAIAAWAQQPVPVTAVWKLPAPALQQTPDNGYDKVYDFGVFIPADTTLRLSGLTFTAPDTYTGQIVISSPGALSLNFYFSRLRMPAGTQFRIFNEYGSLGPYSSADTAANGSFVSIPLGGERCTLQVQGTSAEAFMEADVLQVIYGIRADFLPAKGFGSSGNCNININCPEGDSWQLEKRSAVMLLSNGGNRFCSGAIINNTAKNGRPYILTAAHCNASASTVFMFSYESPDCANIDGPVTQTINGAQVRASYAVSDFTLLEMNVPPPANYFPYYSGWSRVAVPGADHTGIHHPRGDIKKISRDTSMIQSSCYACTDPAETHWKVGKWDAGTTETGSSGSPLYNAAHQIVGQLHGGQASCINQNGSDFYGKFYLSWEGGGTPQTRLKDWLDPLSTDTASLSGWLPGTAPVAYGLDISSLSSSDSITCAESASVFVLLSSFGFEQLDSVCVSMRSDYDSLMLCKGGSWNYGDQIIFSFPERVLPLFGTNRFSVHAFAPGTPAADTATYNVQRVQGAEMRLAIQYDLYPQELSWEILDATGNIAESGSGTGVAPGVTDTFSYCLPYGCYTLRLYDSGSDGICCNWGNGSIQLIDVNDVQLGQWTTFGAVQEFAFCNPHSGSSDDKELFVFPNPASVSVNVALPVSLYGQADLLLICDMNGKVLVKKENDLKYLNTFDVSNWARGVYIVYMRSGKNKARARFVKI